MDLVWSVQISIYSHFVFGHAVRSGCRASCFRYMLASFQSQLGQQDPDPVQCIFPFQSDVYHFGDSCSNCLKKFLYSRWNSCCIFVAKEKSINTSSSNFIFGVYQDKKMEPKIKQAVCWQVRRLLPQCRGVAKVTSPPPHTFYHPPSLYCHIPKVIPVLIAA